LLARVLPVSALLRRNIPSLGGGDALWKAAIVSVGLLTLALGLIRIGAQPTYDERVSVRSSSQGLGLIRELSRTTEAPHVVYYVLLHYWLLAFGKAVWVARLPSVIAGALAAVVTVLLGERLFGRLAGLMAGLVLVTNSSFVAMEQTARSYSATVLLVVFATYMLVCAVEAPSRLRWLLWAGAVAAAAWMNFFAISVLGAHALALISLRDRVGRRAPLLGLAAVVVAVFPIALLISFGDTRQLDWIPAPTPDILVSAIWKWTGRNPLLLLAAAAGIAVLITGAARLLERWKALLLCGWLVAPMTMALALSVVHPAFVSRYLLTASPAVALLSGVGIVSLRRKPAVLLAALLLIAATVRLVEHYADLAHAVPPNV
jgi:mannosyltransferase